MICYSKGQTVSLEKGLYGQIYPMITISKSFKDLETDDYKVFESELFTGGHVGGAIFENTAEAEILCSSPGVTNGGEIWVSKHYVGIFYDRVESFTVKKSADMAPSFVQISPLCYLSSNAAKVMGKRPVGYLPFDDGLIESYDSDEAITLPYFERAMLLNGQPFAFYGVTVGTLGLNFKPTSKMGWAKAMLRNNLYCSENKTYDKDHGIVLTTSNRDAARKFANTIKNGSKVTAPVFTKAYLAPVSLLMGSSQSLYVHRLCNSPELFAANERFAFGFSSDGVGIGVREFINTPSYETAGLILNDPALDKVLEEYERILKELRQAGLVDACKSVYSEYCVVYQNVMKRAMISDELLEFKDSEVFTGSNARLYLNLPKVPVDIGFIPFVSDDGLKGMSENDLKTRYLQFGTEMTKVGSFLKKKTISVKVGDEDAAYVDYSFDEDSYQRYASTLLNNCKRSILNDIGQVITALEQANTTFSPGETSYKYRKGCKTKKDYYSNYHAWQGVIGYPADVLHSTCGDDGSPGGSHQIAAGNKVVKVVVRNASLVDGVFHYTYDLFLDVLYSGHVHGGYSRGNVEGDFRDIARRAITKAGSYRVESDGFGSTNPLGLPVHEGVCSHRGYSKRHSTMVNGDDYACPSVRIVVSHSGSCAVTTDISSSQVVNDFQENIRAINGAAEKVASAWLIQKLEELNVLKDLTLVGRINSVSVPLTSLIKLANFAPASLEMWYQHFERLLNVIDENQKPNIERNLMNIQLSLEYLGYVKSADGWVKANQSPAMPWIMDLQHMTYEASGVDYNLLPMYCYL